jgi:hypothetical protein
MGRRLASVGRRAALSFDERHGRACLFQQPGSGNSCQTSADDRDIDINVAINGRKVRKFRFRPIRLRVHTPSTRAKLSPRRWARNVERTPHPGEIA